MTIKARAFNKPARGQTCGRRAGVAGRMGAKSYEQKILSLDLLLQGSRKRSGLIEEGKG